MFPRAVPLLFVCSFLAAQAPKAEVILLDATGRRPEVFPVGELTAVDAKLLHLRFAAKPIPGFPDDPHVILANGDRLCGRIVGGDARRILVRTIYAGSDVSVGLNQLAAVWRVGPPAELPADPSRYPFLAGSKRDTVLLADRDVLGGLVESMTGESLSVRRDEKTESIAPDRIHAVVFDPSLVRDRKARGPTLRLALRDGSRLTFAELSGDGTTLSGKTVWGSTLTIPASDVRSMERVGTPGADLESTLAMEPADGAGDRPSVNRTHDGQLLRLPVFGVVDRGFRLPVGSRLTVKLGGKFRKWEAVAGLERDSRGAVEIRVAVDGKPLPLNGVNPLPPGEIVSLSLDVSGGKELVLTIAPATRGSVQARVILASPYAIE